jgi:hypothetical protein
VNGKVELGTDGTGGTIAIEASSTPDTLVGHYDITLATGQTIRGDFQASRCAAWESTASFYDQCQPDGHGEQTADGGFDWFYTHACRCGGADFYSSCFLPEDGGPISCTCTGSTWNTKTCEVPRSDMPVSSGSMDSSISCCYRQ